MTALLIVSSQLSNGDMIDPSAHFTLGQQRYYGAHYQRLQAIKQTVDPSNVFHFPTSIQLLDE
jgi:hypothetical protein